MILRYLALAAWVLTAVFVTLVEPSPQPATFQTLLEDRATVTVSARVLEDARSSKGFAGSEKFTTMIVVTSEGALLGKQGSLTGDSEVQSLATGTELKAVLSVRPGFRSDENFSSNLKTLLEIKKSKTKNPLQVMRDTFLANLSGVSPDSAALVAGLTIGDDTQLSPTALEDLKVVSLTHLSAVSGTNCAIVLAGTALLLNLLPIMRSIRLGLSFAVIFAYLGLVGPEPSVLRASVMVGVVLIGFLFGRKVPPLEALSLAVVVLLVFEPSLSLDFGFALSALATWGLLVLAPKLVEIMQKRMPLWLAIVVSVSLSAQIACLPVLLILQPAIPVYSIAANVIAEPMVAPITVIGLVACLLSPLFPMLSSGLCLVASMPASVILFVARKFAAAPSASISWIDGPIGIVIAIILVGSIWAYLNSNKSVFKMTSASVVASILLLFFAHSSSLAMKTGSFYAGSYSIVNCDVGQGDALVIKSQGKVAVVDVGREDPAIDSCLSGLGINKIDLLVLTHYDLDHVGGLVGAVAGREVETALITPFVDDRPGADVTKRTLESFGVQMIKVEKGMNGKLGEYTWTVLAPSRDAKEAEDSNDASTSMYWESEQVALFTLADSGERAQMRMGSEHRTFLQSDFGSRLVIVKVAHHGSGDQAPEFYEAIAADIALISVGRDNSYGHPTRRTLDLLALTGAKVLRTDEMGAIGLTETDTGVEVSIAGRS